MFSSVSCCGFCITPLFVPHESRSTAIMWSACQRSGKGCPQYAHSPPNFILTCSRCVLLSFISAPIKKCGITAHSTRTAEKRGCRLIASVGRQRLPALFTLFWLRFCVQYSDPSVVQIVHQGCALHPNPSEHFKRRPVVVSRFNSPRQPHRPPAKFSLESAHFVLRIKFATQPYVQGRRLPARLNYSLCVKVVLLIQQAPRLLADLAAIKAHRALRHLRPQSTPRTAHKRQPVGGSFARRVRIANPRPACCRVHHHRKKHGSLFHFSDSAPHSSALKRDRCRGPLALRWASQ